MITISTLTLGLLGASLYLSTLNNVDNIQVANADLSKNINVPKVVREDNLQSKDLALNISNKSENTQETKIYDDLDLNVGVNGLHMLKLSENELLEFGIRRKITDCQTSKRPSIGYSTAYSNSAYSNNFFADSCSTHGFQTIEDFKGAVLKVEPNLITNISGEFRAGGRSNLVKESEKDRFLLMYKNLSNLLSFSFSDSLAPKTLPEVIEKDLKEIDLLLAQYLKNPLKLDNLGAEINTLIERCSTNLQKTYPENNDYDLKSNEKLTVMFDEEPNSAENQAIVQDMAKMGVRVIFEKPRIPFNGYLEEKYGDKFHNISIAEKISGNYLLINKMIGIEIPFDNSDPTKGLIFWYLPSEDLLQALPKRVANELKNEFQLVLDNAPVCGAPIDSKKAYLDIWRTCSGAIQNLNIYPNPVKTELNLRFDLNESRMISYEIQDALGNVIPQHHQNLFLNPGVNYNTIYLSDLSKGMYFVIVKSERGEQTMQRFIKE